MLRNKIDVKNLVDGATQQDRFVQLNNLMRNIENERNAQTHSIDQYADMLFQWNRMFELKQTSMNVPPITKAIAWEIYDEIVNGHRTIDRGFQRYVALTRNAQRNIFDMRRELDRSGEPKTAVYDVLHLLNQNNVPFDKLKDTTVVDIYNLLAVVPPLQGFAGYADWGPGNHGSVAANKREHFCKHVLNADRNDAIPWMEEARLWWEVLGIRLSKRDARRLLGIGPFSVVEPLFVPSSTSGDDALLPLDKVPTFVEALRPLRHYDTELTDEMYRRHGQAYVNHALTLSQSMTNIIVHTDPQGGKAYLKGVNGRVYIGGRIEAGVLGISTCFMPKPGVDLAKVNAEHKIWDVSRT